MYRRRLQKYVSNTMANLLINLDDDPSIEIQLKNENNFFYENWVGLNLAYFLIAHMALSTASLSK